MHINNFGSSHLVFSNHFEKTILFFQITLKKQKFPDATAEGAAASGKFPDATAEGGRGMFRNAMNSYAFSAACSKMI